MSVKLLTEHHLRFLSLKEGCKGSSEPTFVKMAHCWKSHALAQLYVDLVDRSGVMINTIYASTCKDLGQSPIQSAQILTACR